MITIPQNCLREVEVFMSHPKPEDLRPDLIQVWIYVLKASFRNGSSLVLTADPRPD